MEAGVTRRAVDYKTYFAFLAPTCLARTRLRRMCTTDENACNNAARDVRASLRINPSLSHPVLDTRFRLGDGGPPPPRIARFLSPFRDDARTCAAVNADALCARTTATAACMHVQRGGGVFPRGHPARYYAVSWFAAISCARHYLWMAGWLLVSQLSRILRCRTGLVSLSLFF